MSATELAIAIDAELPQMQCGRCGFAACRPYAEALSRGTAEITKCTPGGASLVTKLGSLLGRSDADPGAIAETPALRVAAIVERDCIGCTKCLQVCPVAAILGAAKHMHSVLTDLCTGCELCVPACPVDCIALVPAPFVWDEPRARAARKRFEAWTARNAVTAKKPGSEVLGLEAQADRTSMREEIAAAVARRRAQR